MAEKVPAGDVAEVEARVEARLAAIASAIEETREEVDALQARVQQDRRRVQKKTEQIAEWEAATVALTEHLWDVRGEEPPEE